MHASLGTCAQLKKLRLVVYVAKQGFRASSTLLALVTLACVGPSVAQNVLGIDFGSEWIKLAVVQRSAGVQIVLNEVMIACPAQHYIYNQLVWYATGLCGSSCVLRLPFVVII